MGHPHSRRALATPGGPVPHGRRGAYLPPAPGVTLIELLVAVALVGILAAIALPNLLASQQRSRYVQAACNSKAAVTQGIVYANEQNANPGSMQSLRERGYANIGDTDPWGRPWVYSPAFADPSTPAAQGELGVCSTGPRDTGVCAFPMQGPGVAQPEGSVGYSSVYGAWQGTSDPGVAMAGTASAASEAASGAPDSKGGGAGNPGSDRERPGHPAGGRGGGRSSEASSHGGGNSH